MKSVQSKVLFLVFCLMYPSFAMSAKNPASSMNDEINITFEPILGVRLIKTANNSVAKLTFEHEFAPPFSLKKFSIAAADSGNPLGLIEDEFTIERDVTGNIASITGANTGLIYTKAYDPAGRLIGARAGGYSIALAYDGFGRRKAISGSDDITAQLDYDLLNRVTSIIWKEGFSNSVAQYLSYDAAGNIHHVSREGGTYDLTYDDTNQLTSSASQGIPGFPTYNRTFQYDLNGNRINDSVLGNGQFVADFLVQNGVGSYQADGDGFGDLQHANFISGAQRHFAYRPDGKVVGFIDNNVQADYFYDAFGRRIAKRITKGGTTFTQTYVYLGTGFQMLLGKAGDGTITTYIGGQGENDQLAEVRGGVGKTYITDHLGSVLNGEAAGPSKIFGLFGEVANPPIISTSSNPVMYGFTGAEYDAESGLLFLRNRSLDTMAGRFLQPDPIGYSGGDANYYRYVMNNPLRYRDPFGLRPADEVPFPDSFPPAPSINPWTNAENAANDAEKVFPEYAGEDDTADAYRHCLASCMVAEGSGTASSYLLGESYEIYGDIFHGQSPQAKCMDQANNASGRSMKGPGQSCANSCFAGALNGTLQNAPRAQ